ncbi:hypothetical protein EIN_162090 [Entamoeba invadens IP1]|uniref:AIG1-type G domain-containing protein n=1 Tax=Entamoeba invadens IP1 TaxID=370355 RepID=A0A0A1U4E9_ENTIV|nr:hypothetical protein EIN_162090 [Entamoeba invadens IP1]ELP86575.1 hypothetical protein EIN_162090 [Entamoeba invadens IP1]|eukprot:XP_004185921.1 hypothetical protein EIN_162090 [Entamoeba invadens IP1]
MSCQRIVGGKQYQVWYRVSFFGMHGVGITSLIKKLIGDKYNEKATEKDMQSVWLKYKSNTICLLDLIEATVEEDQPPNKKNLIVEKLDLSFIVCSPDQPLSIENLENVRRSADKIIDAGLSNVQFLVLKSDLEILPKQKQIIEKTAETNKAKIFYCSVQSDIGCTELFDFIKTEADIKTRAYLIEKSRANRSKNRVTMALGQFAQKKEEDKIQRDQSVMIKSEICRSETVEYYNPEEDITKTKKEKKCRIV